MLVVALAMSSVLVVLTNLVARRSTGLGFACLTAGLALLPILFCLQSPLLLVNDVLLLLAGLACMIAGAGPKAFLRSSIGVTSATYVLFGVFLAYRLSQSDPLEERYPYESVQARLAYERPIDGHPRFSEESLTSLEDQVRDNESTRRTQALKEIHRTYVWKFVNSEGFGVGRVVGPGYFARIDDAESIPLAHSVPDYVTATRGSVEPTDPSWSALNRLHGNSFLDFANASGFGYVKDREHVAGFQTHHFRQLPEVESTKRSRWRVQNLELVSILKFSEPAVYVTDQLPRMDQLQDAPTRPLDAFEQSRLPALRHGDDLAVDAAPDRIRMLGAIRAVKQCLACHMAERGDLLGAFSYQLVCKDP
jgi:hypothetical protein